MKYLILTSITIIFLGLVGFVQDDLPYDFSPGFNYQVHGTYERAIKREKLNRALLLSDLIPASPINWIPNYDSVEILAICHGKTMRAVNENDTLNREQKKILGAADLGTEIAINITYNYKNAMTHDVEHNKMNISTMIVPQVEAEFVGGYSQMIKYLQENSFSKISEKDVKKFQSVILFTINELGEITDARITNESKDRETDQLLLDVVNKMPKWKPAQDLKGMKVKQEFEFSINKGRGGC